MPGSITLGQVSRHRLILAISPSRPAVPITWSECCRVTTPRATMIAVQTTRRLYKIRVSGRLGPTGLSAFPSMVHQVKGGDTELTGLLEDRSALFEVVAAIEALCLDLLELREIQPGRAPRDP
jgi:hypothetical protein